LCADSCHYYLTFKETKSIPSYKLNLVISVFKKYFSFMGKKASKWINARELNNKTIEEWIDTLFGKCTLCGRCTLNCPMGINIPYLIRVARGALAKINLIPPGLQSTINITLEKGNNMGISSEDWLETVEWLEEELKQEIGNSNIQLPVDKKGAKYLYIINPREAMFFPMSILAVGKIFHAAEESWTLSSKNFDVTNYGFFSGDNKTASIISERLVDSMKELKCKTLVLSECGHGFNSHRWEAPEWLSKKYDFEVKSIIQIIAEYIKDRRIKLNPSLNQKLHTLHDPCNLVRFGGIIEEQRFILKNSVMNFVEMNPNREKNFCCGGGGGQLAMTRFAKRRIEAGRVKAEQIKKTKAEVVIAPCHNCIDQLNELNKHYKLGIEVKTISECVADALII
ncbi:(Fe-S)-binding protein, partial [Candidatus Aminicenantes bacterium AC-335-A11]|nr:(Fe-S)-binding protein [Candidatus Aminicenantes bacterium AC-335-A11]